MAWRWKESLPPTSRARGNSLGSTQPGAMRRFEHGVHRHPRLGVFAHACVSRSAAAKRITSSWPVRSAEAATGLAGETKFAVVAEVAVLAKLQQRRLAGLRQADLAVRRRGGRSRRGRRELDFHRAAADCAHHGSEDGPGQEAKDTTQYGLLPG